MCYAVAIEARKEAELVETIQNSNGTIETGEEPVHPIDGSMDGRSDGLFPPIETNRAERLGVLGSLVAGYLYVMFLTECRGIGWLTAFTAVLTLGVTLSARARRCAAENWVWLGCLWVAQLFAAFGRNRVWGENAPLLIHAFGAYWMLVRCDALTLNGSSRFLPVDLVWGMIVTPCRNCLFRLRVVASSRRGEGRRRSAGEIAATLAAVLVAGGLLVAASRLLSGADVNFAAFVGEFHSAFGALNVPELLGRFIASLPVGAYLYALVFGALRRPEDASLRRRSWVEMALNRLRWVPRGVWPALMGVFCTLYLAFFAMQGSYLFGGLAGVLPRQYTAAQYARQGFFELCGVMALNFGLLGLAQLSAQKGLRAHGASKALSTALLVESLLLAVTAAAKLWLYISRFGFTPLRIQSSWLVLALSAGCLAALRSLWTGRDTTRAWLIFSGVTLALTCVY